MNIPVFHDDQHGTAIISTAAILNGLRVVEKNLSDVRMVVSGAGAAAIACMNLLVALGMQKHNIVVCDSKGVIYKDREPNMAETKAAYAVEDDGKRTLEDVIEGADIFLGCSGPKVLTRGDGVEDGARANDPRPPANPEPEILPPLAKAVREDAIICTGRSDYPNRGEQRALLPVHLPRCAGRRRYGNQRRDEARRRSCYRRAGARRAERSGGLRLRRSGSELRPRLHYP